MKQIKNNILLIIFVCLCVISFAVFAYILAQYNNANEQISNFLEQDDAIDDVRLTYSNDAPKYSNKTIEHHNTREKHSIEFELNGIYFASDIEGMDEQKLHAAAIELFSNLHGDEMNYVSSVVLKAGDERYCKGGMTTEINVYEIPVSLYNFMGNGLYTMEAKVSHLTIENVEADTEVKNMAQALSVAYGYHYVDYYDIVKGTEDDMNSKYYEMRAQDNENIVLSLSDDETAGQNDRWYLKTIATYDYMYMMGSSTANRVAISKGASRSSYQFNSKSGNYLVPTKYQRTRNSHPHINLELPMPDEVEGLYDYFYGFINVQPPVFEDEIKPLEDLNYELEIMKREKEEEQWFRLYDLTWDTITEDPNVLITVVKYDINDEMLCIESVVSGNVTTAPVENFVTLFSDVRWNENTKQYHYYLHETYDEFKIRLVVHYPDGRVRISEPYIFGSSDY